MIITTNIWITLHSHPLLISIVADKKKFKEQTVCIGTECGFANITTNIAAEVECQIPSAVRKQQEM